MSNCSICKDPVPAFDRPQQTHLVIGRDKDNHIHTHGDISRKDQMRELLEAAAESCGLPPKPKAGLIPKAVVFNNKQKIGDSLMFTCAVRDFARAFPDVKLGIRMTAGHIIDHNPYIDQSIDVEDWKRRAMTQVKHLSKEDQEKQTLFDLGDGNYFVKIGPKWLTDKSNSLDWHFANAYRLSMEKQLGITIPQGESRPDIYFTQEEYDAARPIAQPYWTICVNGEKGWGCKMYPIERWQAVVDQNPDLTFVQIGTKGDNPPRLQGPNVIDWVGKTEDKNTGIRDIFKLFLNAEGSIGLVSFHMHLSGALYKPCVVVAGAREPVSFTRYAGHQYLANDGCLPCAVQACWKCDIVRCTNLVDKSGKSIVLQKNAHGEPFADDKQRAEIMPRCVDMIAPEDVTKAIRQYYIGGRLKVGVVSAKPPIRKRPTDQGISVVPTPISRPESVPGGFDAKSKYGLDWGKGAIDPLDWPFIESVLKKNQVKTILEFGSGLSTALFAEHKPAILVSFETEKLWIEKVKAACPSADVRYWNGRELPVESAVHLRIQNEYDLAFVDGPANGQNREQAVRIAANHAKIVILHDATREYESQWEAKYLAPGFQGPIKGGKWCHMWIKTESFVPFAAPPVPPANPNKRRIRIVSTARGWGGCARSITTIMRLLLKAGHDVEFVPFRNKVTSREFIDALKNGLSAVQVSENFDVLREPCDTLLVYADDYVWEFPTPAMAEAFETLNATRKIMMLNYRVGEVGKVPWTQGWDKYLFLNSAQEKDLLKRLPNAETAVYPPCVDLGPFFEVKPNYDAPLSIVRHNSQGDTKFDKDKAQGEIVTALLSRPEAHIHMLPGPSWVEPAERFHKYGRTGIPEQIADFLAKGNLFWYSLPAGYVDAGPRVILEAMAAGLPVIADNWGGAPDRVTPECGWICDTKEQMLDIIKNVTPAELRAKGEAARARALAEFRPERWIDELVVEAFLA